MGPRRRWERVRKRDSHCLAGSKFNIFLLFSCEHISLACKERHFLSPASRSQAASTERDYVWWIPLTYALVAVPPLFDLNADFFYYARLFGEHPSIDSGVVAAEKAAEKDEGFRTKTWDFIIEDYSIARDGFVKLNANSSGYYRTSYPTNIWQALKEAASAQLMVGLNYLTYEFDCIFAFSFAEKRHGDTS